MSTVYQTEISARIMAFVFFGFSVALAIITVWALKMAEGGAYLLVLTTAIFPFILVIVSGLRLAIVLGRRVSLQGGVLHHTQLFKDFHVPLGEIVRVEAMEREDDTVVTLRVIWSGPYWYLDHRSVEGWDTLAAEIKAAVGPDRWVVVEGFEPLESSAG